MTTKYNILFNAKEAFTVGETILKEAFEEDYSSLLPIEPINLRGENFDDTTIVPGFERAEEKAVKAIQKHSIKLNEIQYNRQIEDAYLVLGKARYFDRRFFPALEAFNFLLENGASAPIFTEGKIWREKTNIRLNNFDLAIENLRPLAQNLAPTNKLFPLSNASLAEAFIQLKALDSAAIYLQRAAAQEPKRKNKARYLFISGQLLELLGQQDSAQKAYARIGLLKRKAPRNLLIQAQINTVFLDTSWAPEEQINILKRLLNNYENEPYQHRILSALAKLNLEQQKDSIALDYFEKALAAPTIERFTEMENYQTLSAYFFMQGEYVKTANYL
ncbi:MAG: tetratricopeptide repeat protein, partial [Flavobacteriaceae bacterium]